MIRERDLCRERARISGDNAQWDNYRKLRNAVTKEARKIKKEHFKKLFDTLLLKNDTKRIYSTTKELLGGF